MWDDPVSLAFLDYRPVFDGHCLIIPREHHETLGDLPAEMVEPFFRNVQLLARAVEQGLGVDGTLLVVNNRVSQSVPHLHAHVIPRRRKDGLRGFLWPRHLYASDEAMARVQRALRSAVRDLVRERG